jgi:hypothetical protein
MSHEDAHQAALVANEAAGLPPPSQFGLHITKLITEGRLETSDGLALIILHHQGLQEARINHGY